MELMQHLREATWPQHQALDSAMAQLSPCENTTEELKQKLCLFYGFYASFYPELCCVLKTLQLQEYPPQLQQRLQKLDWLQESLKVWELDTTLLNVSEHAPAVESIPLALGAFYVTEGQTMGGQIFTRQYSEALHWNTEDGPYHPGIRFFASYGEQTMPYWKAFSAWMNAYGEAHPDQVETIVSSAQATFGALSAWIVQFSKAQHVKR
jgi:heme oxygenase